MTDSLHKETSDNISAFLDLEFSNVVVLIEVLHDATLKSLAYIKRRFLERANYFETTLAFLIDIGAVRNSEDVFNITAAMKTYISEATSKETFKVVIVAFLTQKDSIYRSEVFEYLRNFIVTEGHATYKPTATERNRYSPVRNFLMEVDIVIYDKSVDHYAITSENYFILALASGQLSRPFSPLAFEVARKNKEDIGYAAELFILEYERQRLGEDYYLKIEHIAAKNVAAGYDIKSVSVNSSGNDLPRYVEVKAVPKSTYRFYWSSNERYIAKMLGPHYFLYLLPVERDGKMITEELLIIENPTVSVLEFPKQWIIENDVLKCMRNTLYY